MDIVKRTHWVAYKNENFFVSYGCPPPQKLSGFNMKRNGCSLFSEYRIEDLDAFWAAYCLYIIYVTKGIGIDFKSAVLNYYYQTCSVHKLR